LKSGVLSGKYTRATAGQDKTDRAAFMADQLNERTYTLIDELERVAKAHDSTVARVALAWLRARPGVTSTIIGARRLAQLEDNLKSLEITLEPAESAKLDALTQPALGFPHVMLGYAGTITNGGTTVNGVKVPPSQFVMQPGDKPY
jgi:aryl-alcohol dehydrogenase-like predicted oxidoreductase